jgi:hypothetical protein
VDVDVFGASGEQILRRGVLERRGARAVAMVAGPDRQEWPFDLVGGPRSAVLTVAYFLLLLALGAGSRVDVSEVQRVGLGQTAQLELCVDSFGDILEGSRASHPRVALGVQGETCALALVGVVLVVGLGAATAAPYQQEDGRERRGRDQDELPHAAKDNNLAGMVPRPNFLKRRLGEVRDLCHPRVRYFRMRRVGEHPGRRSAPPVDLGTWEPMPTRESQSTQPSGLRFRAVLAEGGDPRVQLHTA